MGQRGQQKRKRVPTKERKKAANLNRCERRARENTCTFKNTPVNYFVVKD